MNTLSVQKGSMVRYTPPIGSSNCEPIYGIVLDVRINPIERNKRPQIRIWWLNGRTFSNFHTNKDWLWLRTLNDEEWTIYPPKTDHV